MALGFDLFQGYFFAQPIILNRRQIPVAPLTLLRLVAALSEADLDVADVAAIVVNDPGLSYRLLRVANSASVGLGHRVESVERAATLMGAEHIRRAAFLAAATETDVPDAVSSLALTRAAMCERIARQDGRNGPAAFTVGLFSLLDVVLQVPMTRALEQLPLTDDVRIAIVDQSGALGALLTEVRAYERGQPLAPRRVKTLAAAYAAAITWSARFV
jgi:c-di-GMP phosphodiesterase